MGEAVDLAVAAREPVTDEREHRDGDANAGADATIDGTVDRKPAALPSIIVDPSLAASAEYEANDTPPESTPPHENGSDRTHADSLSIEDAERFAANIRPSWEPPPGVPIGIDRDEAAASAAPAQAAPSSPVEDEIPELPGAHRRRGLVIAASTVFGFATLAVLGVVSGSASIPQAAQSIARMREGPPAASEPAIREPEPEAPQAAQPAQPATTDEEAQAAALTEAEPQPVASPTEGAEAAQLDPAESEPSVVAEASPESTPAEATSERPEPGEAQPAPAAALPPPAAEPEPIAKTVRVKISATPAHAQLTLDGTPIPNPFDADMVKGGKHRVQARAPGHRSGEVTISLDRDRNVALQLRADKPVTTTAPSTRQNALRPAKPAPASPPAIPAAPNSRGAGFVNESPY
jgi:hypothetical protein